MFDSRDTGSRACNRAVAAAELAESLVEEVSRARRSWRTVERLARELAQLAGEAASEDEAG
jgi:hypothetical protein